MMQTYLNRQCHAAAARIFGSESHEELRKIAARAPFNKASWGDLSDAEARQILQGLESANTAGQELLEQATPGLSTEQQRLKISAIRHSMNWSWAYVRRLVAQYNVTDWRQLTLAQADDLIQRMTKISDSMRRRAKRSSDNA